MASRERMTAVDTAWLRMDRPDNLMMITGIMMLRGNLEFPELKSLLASRFLRFHRFTQKVTSDLSGHYWEDDPDFDLDNHIHRLALPGDGGRDALEALVSDLASMPLARHKPMWEFHIIENVAGNSALVMRLHHCYADGIALVQVLLSMTDRKRGDTDDAAAPAADKRHGSARRGLLQRLYEPATELAETTLQRSRQLWIEGQHLLQEPDEFARLAQQGIAFAGELAHVSMLPPDPPTQLKGRLGNRKQTAWTRSLPLAEVKAVGKALGCTVNDVLLATVAGAIGSYLRDQGDNIDGLQIRATVPVNLRPADQPLSLGNHFGLVYLDLPIGAENPLERVFAVHANMRRLKDSYQPLVSLRLLGAVGMAPAIVQKLAMDLFSSKASAVMSNVPGPAEPLFLAGHEVVQQMFWVPQSGEIGIGVGILSYNGQVQFGLIADSNLIPTPRTVVERFATEFEKLLMIVLMGSWDPASSPEADLRLLTEWINDNLDKRNAARK
jgi:WS/DGAT/MGAT family acyltransferase